MEELRSYYTEKERSIYIKKHTQHKYIKECSSADSNICPKTLADYNKFQDKQKFYVFRSSNILDNIKFHHFYKNDMRPRRVITDRKRYLPLSNVNPSSGRARGESKMRKISMNLSPVETESTPVTVDQRELLIERQSHACGLGIDLKDKTQKLEWMKEQLKSDYRNVHSGLIEIALAKLLPSRPRDIGSQLDIEGSPTSPEMMDEEEDLDELLEIGDGMDEPDTDWSHSKRTTNLSQSMPNSKLNQNLKVDEEIDAESEGDGEPSLDSSESESDTPVKSEMKNKALKNNSKTKRPEGEQTGGLLGITEFDSDDEDNLKARRAFSFVDTNLDKYNIWNYIEDQELRVTNISIK